VNKYVPILGIGFGPSNLALAIALEELGAPIRSRYLEHAHDAKWQAGMLLDGSDIQNNPIRDLVTPRNPKSHYTFINFLKQNGRLFDYLNLGIHYPLRKDYALYLQWVAAQFRQHVSYGVNVTGVTLRDEGPLPAHWAVEVDGGGRLQTRCLILGTGRTPNIPKLMRPHLGDRVFHLSRYLPALGQLANAQPQTIAVIGASQSGVEIILDLMSRFPTLKLAAIHRSFSFRQKDTSPFSDHVYFPEFTDYFFRASPDSKAELKRQLRPTNYSSADIDVLHQLYLRLYEEKLDGNERVAIHNCTDVVSVERSAGRYILELRELHTGELSRIVVDAVVLATGFLDLGSGPGQEPNPPLLDAAADRLARNGDGSLRVNRDYSVDVEAGEHPPALFLNGLCESSHGLGDAGSFSLLALRSHQIAESALQYLNVAHPERSENAADVLIRA
jgi:L-ornithine N5-monooxygenase